MPKALDQPPDYPESCLADVLLERHGRVEDTGNGTGAMGQVQWNYNFKDTLVNARHVWPRAAIPNSILGVLYCIRVRWFPVIAIGGGA